jgi:hypothetical protein
VSANRDLDPLAPYESGPPTWWATTLKVSALAGAGVGGMTVADRGGGPATTAAGVLIGAWTAGVCLLLGTVTAGHLWVRRPRRR